MPSEQCLTVETLCGDEVEAIDSAEFDLSDSRRWVSLLVDADEIEGIMDRLESEYGGNQSYRAVVLEVVASLPDPEDEEASEKESVDAKDESANSAEDRISRNELITQLRPGTEVTGLYLLTVFLSAVIAVVGLMRDSVAVVIGAMVIAPLLMPNMSLALATTLGDLKMGLRSLLTNAAGVALVLLFGLVIGLFVPFDETVRQVQMRTEVGLSDIAVALAAGAAGAVAVTSGVSANLIGVMVAVALLPPMAALALLLGAGHWEMAKGAALLLAVNISCVNLAAVATFLWRGIRPSQHENQLLAKGVTLAALVAWFLAVVLTSMLIWLSGAMKQ